MRYLRFETVEYVIVGPAVDKTDTVTPEVGLDIATADEALWFKQDAAGIGGTAAIDVSGNDWQVVPGGGSMYEIKLTATDTDTLGRARLYVWDTSLCLQIWEDFMVIPQKVWDSMFAGSDNLEVDTVAISGDTTAADNAELDYDGTGYAKANSTIGTCTTNTDVRGTDNAALASVCTEARLAELDGANLPATTDRIETDTQDIQSRIPAALSGGNIKADVLAISEDSGAADNLELDYDGTGYAKANSTIGTCTTNTDVRGTDNAALAAVCTEGRLAELDAANLPTTTDAGATAAALATAQADLDTITGTGGVELATGQTAAWASAQEASAATITEGTVEAGLPLSTTQCNSDVGFANDSLNGRIIIFKVDTTTAALRNRATDITDFANAAGLFTYSTLPVSPVIGDTFVVV